jgi:cell division septum initiation protein DivIVA
MNELNDVLKKVEDLKQENEILKFELKEKCIEIRNLEKKNCDVTHILAQPL